MSDGIKITIGGKLGASYRGSLAQSEKEALSSNARILAGLKSQNLAYSREIEALGGGPGYGTAGSARAAAMVIKQEAVQAQITKIEAAALAERLALQKAGDAETTAAAIRSTSGSLEWAQIAEEQKSEALREGMAKRWLAQKANDAEVTEEAIRSTSGSLEWAQIAEEAKTAALAKGEAERLAIVKAGELAMITEVAKSGSKGGFGGHGGGLAGIIRESLVIVREISMGRGTARVAGSVTLLAQYLGLLGTVVKSTAAEQVKAAAADAKLSQQFAATAVEAEAKAVATREAAIASGMSAEAAEVEAAAQVEVANAYRGAAVAAEAKAAASAQAAEIATASAAVTLGPVGWIALAAVAIGATLFFLVRHINNVKKAWVETEERMGQAGPTFTTIASAIEKATDSLREHARWLEKVSEDYKSVADLADEALNVMKGEAEIELLKAKARGASPEELHRIQQKQMEDQLAYLQQAQAVAAGEAETAQLNEEGTMAATVSPDEIGRQAAIGQGKKGLGDTGEIVDDLKNQLTSMYGQNFIDSYNDRANNNGNFLGHDQSLTSEKGGGFSGTIDEAMAQFQQLSQTVSALTTQSQALGMAEDKAKTRVDETTAARKKIDDQVQTAQTDLMLFKEKGMLGTENRGGHLEMTEWERAGLSGVGPGVSLTDIATQQLKVLHSIDGNTKGGGSSAPGGGRGVSF